MRDTVVDLLPDQFLVAFFLALVAELQEYAPDLFVIDILYSLAEIESLACFQEDMHIVVGIHNSQCHLGLSLGSLSCTTGISKSLYLYPGKRCFCRGWSLTKVKKEILVVYLARLVLVKVIE